MTPPALQTARLRLMAPCADDFAAYGAFFADVEASGPYGGPLSAALAWRKLALDIGHWSLRGFGMWSIRRRDDGAMVGSCGLYWPEGAPRSELTWRIMPQARRKGYALEASRAVVAFGYDVLKWPLVETHMNDDNAAARGLAEALGGAVIARETFPDGITRDVFALPRQTA